MIRRYKTRTELLIAMILRLRRKHGHNPVTNSLITDLQSLFTRKDTPCSTKTSKSRSSTK